MDGDIDYCGEEIMMTRMTTGTDEDEDEDKDQVTIIGT